MDNVPESKTELRLAQLELQIIALKDLLAERTKENTFLKSQLQTIETMATRPVVACMTDNQVVKLAELLRRELNNPVKNLIN